MWRWRKRNRNSRPAEDEGEGKENESGGEASVEGEDVEADLLSGYGFVDGVGADGGALGGDHSGQRSELLVHKAPIHLPLSLEL